jgi:hypothetical protein
MSEVQATGGELVYEDRVPFAWHPLTPDPGPLERARMWDAALTRLNAILTVGEAAPSEAPEEGHPRVQDLARLEARLNLLIAVVGELLAVQRPPPPARVVWLSGQWVEWEEGDPPAPGDSVLVELYLNPGVPDAVALPAQVERVAGEPGGAMRVRVSFGEVPAPLRNALEKLIFRYHRRHVAEQRKGQAGRGS